MIHTCRKSVEPSILFIPVLKCGNDFPKENKTLSRTMLPSSRSEPVATEPVQVRVLQ
ncbi:hypothetical protein HanRHA438_Chr15g0712691 [Helianthus annuus]|uniref:Uncharacterized protein n=1 Tax=Helianthus annuus TaxID=4232 RepID=A0A9K3H3L4_HELAN|nr:hypothetical protein HanXRQr2_Chr15g0700501 [Helianthus annuus]KAJ0831872.1 hypothetical protein HanPSC8_Chr15g0672171 [Helianthus annuus]KAJ0845355.1 hypothetical protein HanRHA438_Chr15g0712691 [Helianthus annuus]